MSNVLAMIVVPDPYANTVMHVGCMSCDWHGRRKRSTRKPCPGCGSINVRRITLDRTGRRDYRWRYNELVSGATEDEVIAAGQDDEMSESIHTNPGDPT